MAKDISQIKYPSFGDIASYKLNEVVTIDEKLFGFPIYWQNKEDGENTGVYLDDNKELQIRTRHTDKLAEDLRERFLALPYAENIRQLLIHLTKFGWDVVIFGEFKVRGKSPKRIELREGNEFVVFDIWLDDPDIKGYSYNPPFIKWDLLSDLCNAFNIPLVKLLEISTVNSLEEIIIVRDRLIAQCKDNRWEGVVGKVWTENANGKYVNFVKEKTEIPKIKVVNEKPQLPDLPESEITGAIEKVLFEIGVKDFSVKEKAMPLIARYIGEECRKHNCQKPGDKTFLLYRERLLRL